MPIKLNSTWRITLRMNPLFAFAVSKFCGSTGKACPVALVVCSQDIKLAWVSHTASNMNEIDYQDNNFGKPGSTVQMQMTLLTSCQNACISTLVHTAVFFPLKSSAVPGTAFQDVKSVRPPAPGACSQRLSL